jgi:hypothetical protein
MVHRISPIETLDWRDNPCQSQTLLGIAGERQGRSAPRFAAMVTCGDIQPTSMV